MKIELSDADIKFLYGLLRLQIIDVKKMVEEYPSATVLRIHLEYLESIYEKIHKQLKKK